MPQETSIIPEISNNKQENDRPGNFGVIYLAFGRPYLAMALNSFISLRNTNPNIPVKIVTNVCAELPRTDLWREELDSWQYIAQATQENRLVKTSIYKYTPFYKTLYLDCDTVILSDISRISFFLDYFDIVLKLSRYSSGRLDRNKNLFGKTIPFHEMPHWNGGVFGFRKNRVSAEFFDIWAERYNQLGHKRDQPSLVEAVFESTCRVLSVSGRWNSGDDIFEKKRLRDEILIWHYKTDIDYFLRSDLLKADKIISYNDKAMDAHTTKQFLDKRAGFANVFTPGKLFRFMVRSIRGRLPERIKRIQKNNSSA